MKGCGVAVAMSQEHSWAPNPSNGTRVNVGTTPPVPTEGAASAHEGKVRCRLMSAGWGGGPVVVGGRESQSQGEGVQQFLSGKAPQGGRR